MSTDLRAQLQATLGDAYTLERELGGGGMSRVFVARDEQLGRDIVVKVLAPELTEGMSAERFAREVRLAARLQHPNIVPVLSAGERDGLAFYTMPYIEGESLRARLAREGRLSVDAAVSVLRDVARALEYAHAHGVVHRDVKPDNVLVAGSAATVADFGIAKALDVARTAGATGDGAPATTAEPLTRVGATLGTPAYMAPEQAAGDPHVDARADLYAWGVLAYELLAGAPPFTGGAAHRVLAAHIADAPTPLDERAPALPEPLAALVMQCLEKDPARRPQTAGELLAALDAARTPTGPTPRTLAPHRASGKLTALVAAGVVLAVALPFVARARRRPAAEQRPVLAVLPFENLGAPADAYFADGLTEEVRSRLAGLTGLRVIGGASARRYKGSTKPLPDIARELGATHVLTATVRFERGPSGGGRVRANPELVRATDQASVWTESVEGSLDDVFAMQTRVAEQVASALDVVLLAAERRAVAARPTSSVAAYDAYLRGLAASSQLRLASGAGLGDAFAEFERAVALDPAFAAAHARLAFAYARHFTIYARGDSALLLKAREHATRAWGLDSTLIESRLGRAEYLLAADEPDAAAATLRAAIAHAPRNADLLVLLAIAEEGAGRYDRALESAQQAMELDPRSDGAAGRLAELYDVNARYEDAIRAREREIALIPEASLAYAAQAWSYLLWRADTAAARRMLDRGGPALETGWLVWIPSMLPSAPSFSHHLLSPVTLRARDTITRAAFVRATPGMRPELFHLMKVRHFTLEGRSAEARVHAESLVVRLAPALAHHDDLWTVFWSMRVALAEAYATLGRPAEARREADRAVAAARRRRDPWALATALLGAARIDVLVGEREAAVAALTECLHPSGGRVSRTLLRADPFWAPLRGNPAFERLLAEPPASR